MIRMAPAIPKHRPFIPGRVRGTSLVEVLVALTIVAVSMLGLLAMQLRAMSMQKDSFDRRAAAMIASDFGERIVANFAGWETGRYSALSFNSLTAGAGTQAACAVPANCTPAEIATRDWVDLQRTVATRLPGGAAAIDSPAGSTWTTIVVGWIDPQRTADLSGTGALAADANCALITDADVATHNQRRCYVINVFP